MAVQVGMDINKDRLYLAGDCPGFLVLEQLIKIKSTKDPYSIQLP